LRLHCCDWIIISKTKKEVHDGQISDRTPSNSSRERCHFIGSHFDCMFGDTLVSFEDFDPKWRQGRAAAACPTWGGCDDRLGESLIHTVKQHPSFLVRHPDTAGGC
jgi:hypothetical protein